MSLVHVPGLAASDRHTLDGPTGHHLARVMRVAPGKVLALMDGQGARCDATVIAVTRDTVEVQMLGRPFTEPALPVAVTLYQGLPKGDKLEIIIQKATELGVTGIVPLATEHAVTRVGADKVDAKLERWRRIAVEAAEQCERATVPIIGSPRNLAAVVLAPGTLALVLEGRPWRDPKPLPALLPANPPPAIALFIGPEGGWSDVELEALDLLGALRAAMGPRILRTETAGPAALAAIMARYEWSPTAS